MTFSPEPPRLRRTNHKDWERQTRIFVEQTRQLRWNEDKIAWKIAEKLEHQDVKILKDTNAKTVEDILERLRERREEDTRITRHRTLLGKLKTRLVPNPQKYFGKYRIIEDPRTNFVEITTRTAEDAATFTAGPQGQN